MGQVRTNNFLEKLLTAIWADFFYDVPRLNQVIIKFGPRAKKRLGSIRRINLCDRGFDTLILINGYFRNNEIPEYVISATIAHEICHYLHGFSSPLPKLSKYPHKGGLVEIELKHRNLSRLLEKEKKWLNKNWLNFIDSQWYPHQ